MGKLQKQSEIKVILKVLKVPFWFYVLSRPSINSRKQTQMKDSDEDMQISTDPIQKDRMFSLKRKITRKKNITSLWNLIMSNQDIMELRGLVQDLEFLMDFGRINFTEFIQEEVKWVRMDIDISLQDYDQKTGVIVPSVTKKSLDLVEEDRFKDQLEGKIITIFQNNNC